MTSEFNALDVDVLCATEIKNDTDSIAAKELCLVRGGATAEVFSEDARVLASGSYERRRNPGVVWITLEAEALVVIGANLPDAPWAAADDVGIAARTDPAPSGKVD